MTSRMKELISILNKNRESYYNGSYSEISDYEYDELYDELVELEGDTGIIMNESPTQQVGYEVRSELQKVRHKYAMLSLDKTKEVERLIDFIGDKEALLMLKMDGLTCCLTYDKDGNLLLCETRGNGEIGLDITHNAKTFKNIPRKINHKGGLVVFGEAIIDYPTFYNINNSLPETEQYKNPRNLCSGSVQQLDSKICAARGVKFIAWRLVDGLNNNSFTQRLFYLKKLGFDIVPFKQISQDKNTLEGYISSAREEAIELGYPIDGLVCGYDDVKYGESLGATSHHIRSQIAFKYGEDRKFSILRSIEWKPSRTGQINPVAIFDTITIADTEVGRASLHNISIIEKLNIKIGSKVEVSKRNEIIPCIENCDGKGDDVVIPNICPICKSPTEIRKDGESKILYCTSDTCESKLLSRLELFVGKDGFDINGLSTAKLQYFINLKWIKNISEIFELKQYKINMYNLPGFGKKSTESLLSAIEKSRVINMSAFIRSLGISMVGRTQSKNLARHCGNSIDKFKHYILDGFNFSELDGIGEKINFEIYKWFNNQENMNIFNQIVSIITIEDDIKPSASTNEGKALDGKVFCITGKLNIFKNRDDLVNSIEANGGKYSSSVSSKTNYLINNDKGSQSSKNDKMKKLGGQIISEEDYVAMLQG